jgi:hypothetical protein
MSENTIKEARFEPTVTQPRIEAFLQSNQKHDKKLMKTFRTLLF